MVNISQSPQQLFPKLQVQSSPGKLWILVPTTEMGRISIENVKLKGSVVWTIQLPVARGRALQVWADHDGQVLAGRQVDAV